MALWLSCVVKYERIKFLVIALKNAVEVYAWAPKPYHKFMAFKVCVCFLFVIQLPPTQQPTLFTPSLSLLLQSFADLPHRPVLVDLTVEEGQRLKVIYGSCAGFHAIDVDSGNNYDIYIPVHVRWTFVREWGRGVRRGGDLFVCHHFFFFLNLQTDSESGDTARHRVPAQLRRDGDAAVLRR